MLLSDRNFSDREHIFAERADEGWQGGGYDWASVIQVLAAERLPPEVAAKLGYDPEAGMCVVYGPRAELEQLAAIAVAAWHDEAMLRDALSRAELD